MATLDDVVKRLRNNLKKKDTNIEKSTLGLADTGVMPGDRIRGRIGSLEGAVIVVDYDAQHASNANIGRPSAGAAVRIRTILDAHRQLLSDPEVADAAQRNYERLVANLLSLPRYGRPTVDGVLEAIQRDESKAKYPSSFEDVAGFKFGVIGAGAPASAFNKRPRDEESEFEQRLMSGEAVVDLAALLENAPELYKTQMRLPMQWTLERGPRLLAPGDAFPAGLDLVIDGITGTRLLAPPPVAEGRSIRIYSLTPEGRPAVGICEPRDMRRLSRAAPLQDIATTVIAAIAASAPHLSRPTAEELDILVPIGNVLSASELKSLMQKIIRLRPRRLLVPRRLGLRNDTFSYVHGDRLFRGDSPATLPPEYTVIDAPVVLLVVLAALMTKPSYFLPELRKTVTGPHSTVKRLLVCAVEDTAVDMDAAVFLAACSLASDIDKTWTPTAQQFARLYTIAHAAWDSRQYFPYDMQRTDPTRLPSLSELLTTVGAAAGGWDFAAAVLSYVGSFGGDKALLWDIATLKLTPRATPGPDRRPELMAFWHFFDQHISGNVLYFSTHAWNGLALKEMMTKLFEVTGCNYRYPLDVTNRIRPLDMTRPADVAQWNDVAIAQYLFFQWRTMETPAHAPAAAAAATTPLRQFEWQLEDSWIAGMLGDTPAGTACFATINVADIDAYRATIKPSRDNKKKTGEAAGEQADLIEEAENTLNALLRRDEGLPLQLSRVRPTETFPYTHLRRRHHDNPYELYDRTTRTWVTWDVASRIQRALPVFRLPAEVEEVAASLARFDSLMLELMMRQRMWRASQFLQVPASDAVFVAHLRSRRPALRARFAQWLTGGRHRELLIPNITRTAEADDAGKLHPLPIDIEVFQALLLPLLLLYPAMLQPRATAVNAYVITEPVLYRHIATLVRDNVSAPPVANPDAMDLEAPEVGEAMAPFVFPYARPPPGKHADIDMLMTEVGRPIVLDAEGQRRVRAWTQHNPDFFTQDRKSASRRLLPHQLSAIWKLYMGGRRGVTPIRQFLIMEPGSGKTYAVLMALKLLIREGLGPTRCVYTVPSAAFEDIRNELQALGYRVHVSDGRHLDTFHLAEGHVLLIQHDHLRKSSAFLEHLADLGSELGVFFDEAHKMQNATQRTAAALRMATSAGLYFAFTGTPVTSHDPMKLAPWLAMQVPYSVTPKNIWTSMGAFVHQPIDSDIVAETTTHDIAGISEDARYTAFRAKILARIDAEKNFRQMLDYVYQRGLETVVVPLLRRELAEPSAAAPRRSGNRRIAIVVNRNQDVAMARALFERELGLGPADIGVIDSANPMSFNDSAVAEGRTPDYRLLLIPKSICEGYSASRCETMITFPYPSNEASRTQLRMRICRADQLAPAVRYHVVTGGVLSAMYDKQHAAQQLADALQILLDEGRGEGTNPVAKKPRLQVGPV